MSFLDNIENNNNNLLVIYYMPALLSTLHVSFPHHNKPMWQIVITSILQKATLKHTEVK